MTRLLKTSAAIALGLALLAALAPRMPTSAPVAKLIAVVLAIVALLVTAWAAPARGPHRLAWFCAVVLVEISLFVLELAPDTPPHVCLLVLVLLTAGGIVGGYIGSLLEFPGMLMVVSYVAALADCCSVFHPHGLSSEVLRHPRALALLMLSVPLLGSERIIPVVGIGDIAFVSIFVAGARATGLAPARTLLALGTAMATVALAVELVQRPLPAIPFLGAAVVLAHPEARRLPVRQARRVAVNLVVVTLVLGGLLWSGLYHARQAAAHEPSAGASSAQ